MPSPPDASPFSGPLAGLGEPWAPSGAPSLPFTPRLARTEEPRPEVPTSATFRFTWGHQTGEKTNRMPLATRGRNQPVRSFNTGQRPMNQTGSFLPSSSAWPCLIPPQNCHSRDACGVLLQTWHQPAAKAGPPASLGCPMLPSSRCARSFLPGRASKHQRYRNGPQPLL